MIETVDHANTEILWVLLETGVDADDSVTMAENLWCAMVAAALGERP